MDLTQAAKSNKLDPTIGRELEIKSLNHQEKLKLKSNLFPTA